MPEVAFIYKLIWSLWGCVTFGVGLWVKELNKTIKDHGISLTEQGNRLTKLESDAITKAQVLTMIADMEHRWVDTFKDFRIELKEDFKDLRADLKEDMKERRRTDKQD